jgi:hypothetical protein
MCVGRYLHAMKAYGNVQVLLHQFLTYGIHGVNVSLLSWLLVHQLNQYTRSLRLAI